MKVKSIQLKKGVKMLNTILHKLDEIQSEILNRGDRWLNTKDACTYSGVSSKTLDRAVIKGVLKVSKKSGRNLYKKSDLDKWLR